MKIRYQGGPGADAMMITREKDARPVLPDRSHNVTEDEEAMGIRQGARGHRSGSKLSPADGACMPARRRREGLRVPDQPYELLFTAIDRLNREKSELLEEVRQLRAAVSIYRRIAEQATANRLAAKADQAA